MSRARAASPSPRYPKISGPRSTRKSSSAWLTGEKVKASWLIPAIPMRIRIPPGSAAAPAAGLFDRAGAHALDDPALQEHEDRDERHAGERRQGHDPVPVPHVLPEEGREAHGQRLRPRGLGEHDGQEVLVPGADKDERRHAD